MAVPSGSFEPRPAGPAAARVLELAAGLAALTARVGGDERLDEEALRLRAEAEALGQADAEAYESFLRAPGPETRDRTIDLPARTAGLAAEIAELAATAAEQGRGAVRWDAAAGAVLAESAARVAALLVEANLAGHADSRVQHARSAAKRAGAAARRALAAASRRDR